MNKSELMKLKPLKLGKKMLHVALQDRGEQRTQYKWPGGKTRYVWTYKYYDFLAAAVENGILKVGLWKRDSVLSHQMQPDFTIFLEKTKYEWLTYEHKTDKWYTGMIFNLPIVVYGGEPFGAAKYATEETEKIISDYLGIKDSAYAAVRRFQVSYKKDILQKRHKSEMARIDEFMESVPDYPAGYNNQWMRRALFEHEAPIVYRPGQKTVKGICLRCEKEVEIKMKPEHGQAVKCPSCKHPARLRSWGKQKTIYERKPVGILLPTKTGDFCLCVHDLYVWFEREEDYKEMHIAKYGDYRFRLDEWFTNHDTFEWYEYKNTGIMRWCRAKVHGMGWSATMASDYCRLYTGNLRQVLRDTAIKYVPVKEIFESAKKPTHVISTLGTIRNRRNMIEKLAKVGLLGLVWTDINETYGRDELYRSGSSLEEILRMDKERVKAAIRLKATLQEVKVLQAGYTARVYLKDSLIKGIAEFYGNRGTNDLHFIVQRRNLEKQINYMRKLPTYSEWKALEVARDYEDFLRQLEELGIPKTKENKFPANFYQVHAELQTEIDSKKEVLEKKQTAAKNRVLRRLIKGLKTKYELESETYIIVWPESKADFTKEGQLQHNCVGGYFDKMVKNETIVFFLRKKEDPETPFCTVEFKRNRCVQCRMIYNRDAEQDAWEYMKKLEQHLLDQEQREEEKMAI